MKTGVTLASLLAIVVSAATLSFLQIGTHDFQAYWLGTQLFLQGKNPYDLSLHQSLAAQSLIEPFLGLSLWNPPWVFLILTPFAAWSFEYSLFALHFLNFLLSAGIGIICAQLFPGQISNRALAILLVLVFPPILVNFYLGQIGIVIAFGVLSGLWALSVRRDYWAGLLFLIASPKPHSWYLLAFLIGIYLVTHKRWKVLLSAFTGFSALIISCLVINRHIFSQWLQTTNNPLSLASSSSVTFIRFLFSEPGLFVSWPVYLIPAVTMLISITVLHFYSDRIEQDLLAVLSTVICSFTMPFGWIFDQVILIVCFLLAVFATFMPPSASPRPTIASVVLATAPILSMFIFLQLHPHWYGLFPLLILTLWLFARRIYCHTR